MQRCLRHTGHTRAVPRMQSTPIIAVLIGRWWCVTINPRTRGSGNYAATYRLADSVDIVGIDEERDPLCESDRDVRSRARIWTTPITRSSTDAGSRRCTNWSVHKVSRMKPSLSIERAVMSIDSIETDRRDNLPLARAFEGGNYGYRGYPPI